MKEMQHFLGARKTQKERWKDENLGCSKCKQKGFTAKQLEEHARTCPAAKAKKQKAQKGTTRDVFSWDDPFQEAGGSSSATAPQAPVSSIIPAAQSSLSSDSTTVQPQVAQRSFSSLVQDAGPSLVEEFYLELKRIEQRKRPQVKTPVVSFVRPGVDWMKMVEVPNSQSHTRIALPVRHMGRKRARPEQWIAPAEEDFYELSRYRFAKRCESGNAHTSFRHVIEKIDKEKLVHEVRMALHKLQQGKKAHEPARPSPSIKPTSHLEVHNTNYAGTPPVQPISTRASPVTAGAPVQSPPERSKSPTDMLSATKPASQMQQVGPSLQTTPPLHVNPSQQAPQQHPQQQHPQQQQRQLRQPPQHAPHAPQQNIVDAFVHAKHIPRRGRVRICATQGATIRSGVDIDQSTTVARAKLGEILDYDAISVLVPGIGQEDCVPVVRLHVRLPTGEHGWISTHGRTVESNYLLAEALPSQTQRPTPTQLPQPRVQQPAAISCPLCEADLTSLNVRAREAADESIEREITSSSSGNSEANAPSAPFPSAAPARPESLPPKSAPRLMEQHIPAATAAPPLRPVAKQPPRSAMPAPGALTAQPAAAPTAPASLNSGQSKRPKLASICIRPVFPPAEATATSSHTPQPQSATSQSTHANTTQGARIKQCPLCQIRFPAHQSDAVVNRHIQNCASSFNDAHW